MLRLGAAQARRERGRAVARAAIGGREHVGLGDPARGAAARRGARGPRPWRPRRVPPPGDTFTPAGVAPGASRPAAPGRAWQAGARRPRPRRRRARGGRRRSLGGRAVAADGDARDHLADGDGLALGHEDLGDRPRGRGRELHVDLVGGDLDDRLRRA